MLRKYLKPALSCTQQIDLYASRGLNFADQHSAQKSLETVSYYRFSGYCKPFQQANDEFIPGTSFQHIWDLYNFDKELRLLLLNAIETIEICFRTAISNHLCLTYDPYWYADPQLFKNPRFYTDFSSMLYDICRKEDEVFIQHFYAKYSFPDMPPAWMLIECLSFGTLVQIFKNLSKMDDKNKIAKTLGYHATMIESWMNSLVYTRNICAHHARLWNRWFVFRPKLPGVYTNRWNIGAHTFYEQALVITLLLKFIAPKWGWQEKLFKLLEQNPKVAKTTMGFTANWQQDKLWTI